MAACLPPLAPGPRPRASVGRLLATLLAALAALAATALPAFGHAALRETVPFDGETVAEAPDEVTLTFNEPVTSATGALRVFSSEGVRADTAEQRQLDDETVTVALRDGLDDGTYLATYRVTSADGHVIRGAFVFSIGSPDEVDDATLAALFAGGDGILPAVAALLRALAYAGALVAGGAVLWVWRVDQSDGDRDLAATWLRRGAVTTVVATLLAVPVQAMLTSGLGFGAVFGPSLTETLTASVGVAAGVRIAGGVLLLATAAGVGRGAGAALLLGSFLIDGHTRTVDPAWLLWLGDAVHVLAAAVWAGGLVVLAASLRARRRADDPAAAATLVASFSGLALTALIAVTVAGSAMAWALVRQPRALTSTDYGWTLLVKVGLVGVVALVGAYNRRQLVPAIVHTEDEDGAEAAWTSLRGTVRFEVAVLAAVVVATAFLVNLRPAAEAAGITGAFDTVVAVTDELSVNLVVDPNRTGFNEIHLYVFDATGRPTSDIQDITLNLSQPDRDIGPIERDTFVAGPGHWQLTGRDLAVPGRWVIDVVLGIDRFTVETTQVEVVVNP